MRAKESPGKAGEGRPWDGDGKSVAEALPAVFHQPLNAFFLSFPELQLWTWMEDCLEGIIFGLACLVRMDELH